MLLKKNIGIQLRVTPRINEKTKITLLVDATVEALLSAAEINTDQPRSTNRTVRTQVTVSDGDTVIIGGLIAENILENKKFVPVLSDLPFIGKNVSIYSADKRAKRTFNFYHTKRSRVLNMKKNLPYIFISFAVVIVVLVSSFLTFTIILNIICLIEDLKVEV